MNVGKVITAITMSLDGFIAGPHDDVGPLFKWYFSGTTDIPVQDGRMVLKVSPQSAELLEAIRERKRGCELDARVAEQTAHCLLR